MQPNKVNTTRNTKKNSACICTNCTRVSCNASNSANAFDQNFWSPTENSFWFLSSCRHRETDRRSFLMRPRSPGRRRNINTSVTVTGYRVIHRKDMTLMSYHYESYHHLGLDDHVRRLTAAYGRRAGPRRVVSASCDVVRRRRAVGHVDDAA